MGNGHPKGKKCVRYRVKVVQVLGPGPRTGRSVWVLDMQRHGF